MSTLSDKRPCALATATITKNIIKRPSGSGSESHVGRYSVLGFSVIADMSSASSTVLAEP